jgi:16S rRNA (guanine966-N2)-methyltransferase
VERDTALVQALRATVARLSAQSSVEVVQSDALAWLSRQAPASFDLAFVDPPFDAGLWQATLDVLLPTLAPNAWVYVESPHDQAPALPSQWGLHREGRTREVRFALYRAPDRRGADTLNGNVSVAVPE